jgi:predicted double-glycine peptidase
MFEAGDQDRIRREGFSLLDMSNYLNARGFRATGYRIGFDIIEKIKAPFIALVNHDGYNHFVVVKSIAGPSVLVGDPNRGNVVYDRERFAGMWNGISLIVTNHAQAARALFDSRKEWTYAHARALPSLGERPGMDSTGLAFSNWQIVPAGTDIVSSINTALGGGP